jgi:hypothetical protein
MASFNLFNKFLSQLANGGYNLGSDTLKFALTNTAPTAATDTVFDPITKHPPPAAANGYTTGGHAATIDSSAESGGTYTLACTTDVIITATAGGIGPFRYVILYDDTSATDMLIGYWDYGSSITLAAGETFTIDVTASLLTIAAAT